MDQDQILERERHQIEQIRELDDEELQVEEVESIYSSSDDDDLNGQASGSEVIFNASLVSLHTYLGDVEDNHHRLTFLDGGAIFNLPLFCLQGVVLFPGATLPLRVIQQNYVGAIERAMSPVDATYIVGVVHVYRDLDNGRLRFGRVGTTAEVRKYHRLEDGSVNVVTCGQQRFRVRRQWIDVDGVPCGEVQIVEEDLPLRIPRDAFGILPPLSDWNGQKLSNNLSTCSKKRSQYEETYPGTDSEESFESELSASEMRLHQSAISSCCGSDIIDKSTSSDDEGHELWVQSGRSEISGLTGLLQLNDKGKAKADLGVEGKAMKRISPHAKGLRRALRVSRYRQSREVVPRAFWPYWVYQMYDSFSLAQKAAEMWKQIVGMPSMDAFIRNPGSLSFCIASKIPVSESMRQELLEIDGISYRLRREIELLENFDRVSCKSCKTVIARRSDLVMMSREAPLGAYVNPGGFVHQTMTLHKANGLALVGHPETKFSWFPGYAWTIANCANCETHMGWLFTATNKKLKPKSFWGIRCCQIADDMS